MYTEKVSKEQMLKEMGEYMARRNSKIKPKQARRVIAKQLKHASYEDWLGLYQDAKKRG